ncbi:MAG: ATP-binding protein [Pseudomonadota bacterium]
MKNVWLWWSSGKDSAWSLHTLLQDPDVQVTSLVTSVNIVAERVAMHATRRTLLEAQASALGVPIRIMPLPWPCPNGAYEAEAAKVIAAAEAAGVTHMAFGDLFLEDIRAYREGLLADSSIVPIFPLWQQNTAALAREMIDGGIAAYLTCVDPKQLDASFVGRKFDHALLEALPDTVDPCGENGEFHSFVYRSPDYAEPLAVSVGERVERDGFWFADIVAL